MLIKIKVTKEVLERSKNCYGPAIITNCAVAEALKPFPFGVFDRIAVLESGVPGEVVYFDQDGMDFISEFDKRIPETRALMKPTEFMSAWTVALVNKLGRDHIFKVLSESKTMEFVSFDTQKIVSND